jgi:predicted kinase
LARELAFRLGIDHLATDIERKRLAGIAPTKRGEDIYSGEWNEKTYRRLAELAGERLERGESVLVDGTFRRREDRDNFAALATKTGSHFIILRLNAPPEMIKYRLKAREQDKTTISDGNWEIYRKQVETFEEPDSSEGNVVQLDATLSPTMMADNVLKQLGLI